MPLPKHCCFISQESPASYVVGMHVNNLIIQKKNASIQVNQQLFHKNWPGSGEWLLGKGS